MKRRSRKSQMLRAKRATGNYAVADSALSRRDLDARRAYCWLQGYDAARRDMREERKLETRVIETRPPGKCHKCFVPTEPGYDYCKDHRAIRFKPL